MIVSGYAFMTGNVGDQAITAGMTDLIAEFSPSQHHVVLTNKDEASIKAKFKRYQDKIGANNLHLDQFDVDMKLFRSNVAPSVEFLNDLLKSSNLRRFILKTSRLDKANMALLASGELLFSYGTAADDWRLLGYTLPFLAAGEEGIPYGLLPATYGPFQSEFSKILISRLLHNAKFNMTRDANISYLPDEHSAAVVEGLDMAFFMERKAWTPTKVTSAARKTVSIIPRLEKFGLRMGRESVPFLQNITRKNYKNSDSVAFYVALIRQLLSNGKIKVVLLPQTENDKPVVKAIDRVLRKMGTDLSGYTVHHDLRIDIYLDRIDRSAALVTSRLHSMIFAAMRGIPSVMAVTEGHGHKSESMMKMLQMSDFVTHIRNSPTVEAARATQQLYALLENLPQRINMLAQCVDEKKRETLKVLRAVLPS